MTAQTVTPTPDTLPPEQLPYQLKQHPYGRLFPPMIGDAFTALVKDIEINGQRDPVTIHEKMVLEGWNRVRACVELRRQVKVKLFEGNDPIAFVLSTNLHRRHLDTSQRALIAGKLPKVDHGGVRTKAPIGEMTIEQRAKFLNVGTKSVERADKVLEKCLPEIVAAIEQGNLNVGAAEALADKTPEDQRALLHKHKDKKNSFALAAQEAKASDRVNFSEIVEKLTNTLVEKLKEWKGTGPNSGAIAATAKLIELLNAADLIEEKKKVV
jgi:hypothetical protein